MENLTYKKNYSGSAGLKMIICEILQLLAPIPRSYNLIPTELYMLVLEVQYERSPFTPGSGWLVIQHTSQLLCMKSVLVREQETLMACLTLLFIDIFTTVSKVTSLHCFHQQLPYT